MIPTRRLLAFVALAILLAVAAGYAPPARVPLYVYDTLLVLAVAADGVWMRGRRVHAERHVGAIFSVGRTNGVVLMLHNGSRRGLRGTVMDDPLPDAKTSGVPCAFELAPHGTFSARYEITPTRRGPRSFGVVTVRYRSLLGLVDRQERTTFPSEVDVYPDVHAARALELLRRQGRQDARLGSLRVRGGDTEFERLRPYQRGDETRHVDWRASARRDDLTVRQFQAESNQNVMFALDVGRAMRGESQGLTQLDVALNAALLTADVALRAGDKAGLFAFDDAPRAFVGPSGGRTGARRLTRAAYALEPGFAATDYRAAVGFFQGQLRTRSLLILFTNLLESRSAQELVSALKSVSRRHLALCILMRDTDVEALATEPLRGEADLYARAAAAEWLGWRDTMIASLKNAGVLVLDGKPEDITPELVRQYLDIKARRLL